MRGTFYQKWTTDQRLRMAKDRTSLLINNLLDHLPLHESNRIITYSPTVSSKIPRSYAANAFNILQRNLSFFEFSRISAIWDKAGDDRISIPTITALIDCDEIVCRHISETRQHIMTECLLHVSSENERTSNLVREWWDRDRAKRADAECTKIKDRLHTTLTKSKEISSSSRIKSLREFRDRHLAHNLDSSQSESRPPSDTQSVIYGDERHLFESALEIADLIHIALNRTSFDWESARISAQRDANELWLNCNFTIPTQSRKGIRIDRPVLPE